MIMKRINLAIDAMYFIVLNGKRVEQTIRLYANGIDFERLEHSLEEWLNAYNPGFYIDGWAGFSVICRTDGRLFETPTQYFAAPDYLHGLSFYRFAS